MMYVSQTKAIYDSYSKKSKEAVDSCNGDLSVLDNDTLTQIENEVYASRDNPDILLDEWMSAGNFLWHLRTSLYQKMEKMEAKLEGQKRNKEVKLFFSEKKRQIKIVEAMLEKHERLEELSDIPIYGDAANG